MAGPCEYVVKVQSFDGEAQSRGHPRQDVTLEVGLHPVREEIRVIRDASEKNALVGAERQDLFDGAIRESLVLGGGGTTGAKPFGMCVGY